MRVAINPAPLLRSRFIFKHFIDGLIATNGFLVAIPKQSGSNPGQRTARGARQ